MEEDLKSFAKDVYINNAFVEIDDESKTTEVVKEIIKEKTIVEQPIIVQGEKGESGKDGRDADLSIFETKFNELIRRWDARISMLASQVINQTPGGGGAGGGSTRVMENDDVVFKQLSELQDGESLHYNVNTSKFEATGS